MSDRANYSAVETLRNGRRVVIRGFRADDRDQFLAAIGRTSTLSLYRRFFTIKRSFTADEMAFFLNVDFVKHVALVALMEEGEEPVIVGGGRYVVVAQGKAEIAFVVIDGCQGQGIGAALMRHLSGIARDAGLRTLIAEVLPQNTSMLKVLERCGLGTTATREPEVVHVAVELN